MRTPVILVAVTLTVAILIASLLIFAGTRKSSGSSMLNIPSPTALIGLKG